jgi:hypothetical protein
MAGLQDRRLGGAAALAAPVDETLQIVTVHESRYTGWTMKHFYERWQAEYGGRRSFYLDQEPAAMGRTRAADVPARGTSQEAAPQAVTGDDAPPGRLPASMGAQSCQWELIVTMDAATSELYSAFFVEEEGTMSSFQGVHVKTEVGCPQITDLRCPLFTDEIVQSAWSDYHIRGALPGFRDRRARPSSSSRSQ